MFKKIRSWLLSTLKSSTQSPQLQHSKCLNCEGGECQEIPFFIHFVCVCVCVKKTFPIQSMLNTCINYISMVSFWNAVWYQTNLILNLPAPPHGMLCSKKKKNAGNTYNSSSRSHNFCKDGNHVNAIIIMKIKNETHYILITWLILLKLYNNVSGHACPIMPMQIQCTVEPR